MLAYLLRRLAGILPALLVLVTISFFVIRLAPGGPFDAQQSLPPEVKANLEAAYGLDRPLLEQYGRYVLGLLHGELGPSFKLRDTQVTELVARGLPVSALLGLAALLVGLTLGIALGVGAGLAPGRSLDRGASVFAAAGIALPSFVIAPLLALIFGVYLQWLPVAGWQPDPAHLLLPVITLALPLAAVVARLTRNGLLEAMRSEFVRTARAKGLPEHTVVLRHALRPALLPVVSYLAPATAAVITGSLVVETLFALPGTGRYLVQGALDRDYSLVMGMVILYGTLTLLASLAADLLYAWLDPRVRHD